MDIVNLLRQEGKESSGHLEHTLHLIADLNDLHERLLVLPAGEKYRKVFAALAPEMPALRVKLGKTDVSDIEFCFRALYAVVLYRIKGDKSHEEGIRNVIDLISPVIAELASVYRQVERGEIDLYGSDKNNATK